jgi:hypothetical protein
MQHVSVRTLVLMVLLLGAVLAHQNLDRAATAQPGAMWLLPDDPNGPPPEYIDLDQAPRCQTGNPDDPNNPPE